MLTCREVSRSIAADEIETAGWRRRLPIELHLLICRHCRSYARQLEGLGRAARSLIERSPLTPDSKERLRRSILGRIPPADSADSDSYG